MNERPPERNDVHLDRDEYNSAVQCLRNIETALYLFSQAGGTSSAEAAGHARQVLHIIESLNCTALSCLELPPQR